MKIGDDMTDDKIEEIRRKKAEEMLKQHHNNELPPQMLTWSFRVNPQSGYCEIMQFDNMVSLTLDPKWAKLVCDMLNSLEIAKQAEGVGNEV
jgi:DNA-binding TFAR19-related protein (PDSD5 family)